MIYYSNHNYPPSKRSGFGVTDKVADFISTHSAICLFTASLAWFLILMFIKPNKWILWLFISPILTWMSSSILLILGLIEWIIWKISTTLKKARF